MRLVGGGIAEDGGGVREGSAQGTSRCRGEEMSGEERRGREPEGAKRGGGGQRGGGGAKGGARPHTLCFARDASETRGRPSVDFVKSVEGLRGTHHTSSNAT